MTKKASNVEKIRFMCDADIYTLREENYFEGDGVKVVKVSKSGLIFTFDLSEADEDSMEEILQYTNLAWDYA